MQLPPFLATPKLRWRAVIYLVISLLIFYLVYAGWKALIPFFIGFLIVYLLLPLVNWFDRVLVEAVKRKRLARVLAVTIVCIIVLGIITLFIFTFVPAFRIQFQMLTKAIPTLYRRILQVVHTDLPQLMQRVPPELQDFINRNVNQATEALAAALQRGLSSTFSIITQTISFILGALVVPVWIFIVLLDEEKAWRGFYSLIPSKAHDDVRNLITIMDGVMNAYVRSQIIGMFVIWILTTVTFMAMGVDLAMIWGALAGLTEVIPIIGPYLGVIPPFIWTLATNIDMTIWVVVAYVIVQNVAGSLIMPHISGSATHIHPAIIMVLVLIGTEIAGFWGLLLIIPVTAMTRDVFRYLYIRTTASGKTPDEAMRVFEERINAQNTRRLALIKG